MKYYTVPHEDFVSFTFREGAKSTAVRAYIGVIDIPIHYVADDIAARLRANFVCSGNNRIDIPAARAKQPRHVILVQTGAVDGLC